MSTQRAITNRREAYALAERLARSDDHSIASYVTKLITHRALVSALRGKKPHELNLFEARDAAALLAPPDWILDGSPVVTVKVGFEEKTFSGEFVTISVDGELDRLLIVSATDALEFANELRCLARDGGKVFLKSQFSSTSPNLTASRKGSAILFQYEDESGSRNTLTTSFVGIAATAIECAAWYARGSVEPSDYH